MTFCPLSKKLWTWKWTCKCRLHLEGWWKAVFGCAEEAQVQRVQDQSLLYSKTSNNGSSEKRTTSEKWTPLNSEQRTLTSPRRTLANTKLPPRTDSEITPTYCRRLSTAFVMPPLLDSKTEHYIRTVAHRASLSRQCKATEKSKNATSSCLTITAYHARLPEVYRMPITDTSVFWARSSGPL